jgi:gas vesicle protein
MENDTSSNLIWFAAGVSIGASVALLFAPMTGRKMQKQVKDVIDDQVDNLQTAFRKVAK